MRIAIAGAGLAGLAAAAAFTRRGHDVTVYEQADSLRASGLAVNIWSNATSLLPALGVPADRVPLPADACVNVVRPGFFSGIFRLPAGRVTRFAEQPGRALGTCDEFLTELAADADPVLRAVARATAPGQWTEWSAADMWPPAVQYRGNIVLAGDAAHAALPTIGQGACQSLEDGVALAAAVAEVGDLDQALRRYEQARVRRVRLITTLARTSALARRPGAVSRMLSATATARVFALTGGPVLRRLARPDAALAGQVSRLSADASGTAR